MKKLLLVGISMVSIASAQSLTISGGLTSNYYEGEAFYSANFGLSMGVADLGIGKVKARIVADISTSKNNNTVMVSAQPLVNFNVAGINAYAGPSVGYATTGNQGYLSLGGVAGVSVPIMENFSVFAEGVYTYYPAASTGNMGARAGLSYNLGF